MLWDVQASTLVLFGDDDPLAPVANGKIISYLLPNSRLLVLEGEGHLMVMDERSASHAVIREFLSAEDPERSESWTRGSRVDARQVRDALTLDRRQLRPLSLLDARARRTWLGRAVSQTNIGPATVAGTATTEQQAVRVANVVPPARPKGPMTSRR